MIGSRGVSSKTDITFYGERGVVNGLILDIKDDLNELKCFLRAIKFPGASQISWIDDLIGMSWFVEPSFSEFGSPDILMIAQTENEKYAFFIEAKLISYNDASKIIDIASTEHHYRKASKLNIQLALRYRFAQAFKRKTHSDKICEESDPLSLPYGDFNRRIHNQRIVEWCTVNLHDIKEYYFIALTNDNKNTQPYHTSIFLPPIGPNEWINQQDHFGLLSYDALESIPCRDTKENKIDGIVNRNQGYYGAAAKMMLGLPADSSALSHVQMVEQVSTINFASWSSEQIECANRMIKLIEPVIVKKLDGSYSIKKFNATVLKIFTKISETQQVFIGLRDDNLPEEVKEIKKYQTYGFGSQKIIFRCFPLINNDEYEKVMLVVRKFLDIRETISIDLETKINTDKLL